MRQIVFYVGFYLHGFSLVICAILTVDVPECTFFKNSFVFSHGFTTFSQVTVHLFVPAFGQLLGYPYHPALW